MTKREVRSEVLSMREKLSDEAVASMSGSIIERLEDFPAYVSAGVVMAYMDYRKEVMTTRLIERALASGKRIVLPLTVPEQRRLLLIEVRDIKNDIAEGFKGIREPVYDIARSVNAGEVDLVIVPGVVFDARGYRIGYGGGYYDRFLMNTGACKVGLAFEMQMRPVTEEEHDIKMDYIITEKRMIECKYIHNERNDAL